MMWRVAVKLLYVLDSARQMFICFYLFQNGSVDKINKTAFLDIKEPS
jgi:hypothetical protein